MVKCHVCGEDGFFQQVHEGTGKSFLIRNNVPHNCKPKKTESDKYWCVACGDNGAAIPKANPCVHRRPDELRRYTELHQVKPQKRLFESDDA